MVLYYALGGGLGHLVRARAVLAALGLAAEAAVVTASPFAGDERVTGGLPVVRMPAALDGDRAACTRWLERLVAERRPETLFVDAFPGGIVGELCELRAPEAVSLVHVARRLRWGAYARRFPGGLPRYERAYLLEELDADHARAIASCAGHVEALDLAERTAVQSAGTLDSEASGERPVWLVVHSGPPAEVADLARFADDERRIEGAEVEIVVVSPLARVDLPDGARLLDHHPAAELFPAAARIFTACGFNSMRETEPFRERHRFVPYPRALDDQFARAAAATRRQAREPEPAGGRALHALP